MNKYNSRSEVPEKYKWDLTDFFINDEDFENRLNEFNIKLEQAKDFIGCTKDREKLYSFLNYLFDTFCLGENLEVYAFLKNDEELGNSVSINRVNRIDNLFEKFVNNISFFEPELLNLSKDDYNSLFENKELLEYKFYLDEIYKSKDHILSENEEIIVNQLFNAMDHFSDKIGRAHV